jgi:hypothetical protein
MVEKGAMEGAMGVASSLSALIGKNRLDLLFVDSNKTYTRKL